MIDVRCLCLWVWVLIGIFRLSIDNLDIRYDCFDHLIEFVCIKIAMACILVQLATGRWFCFKCFCANVKCILFIPWHRKMHSAIDKLNEESGKDTQILSMMQPMHRIVAHFNKLMDWLDLWIQWFPRVSSILAPASYQQCVQRFGYIEWVLLTSHLSQVNWTFVQFQSKSVSHSQILFL